MLSGARATRLRRVSTSDQDTHIQQAKLRDAGCAVIRAEKASGKARGGRSELEVVMSFVRPGDTLVVVKLDQLGRSIRDVLNLVHELEAARRSPPRPRACNRHRGTDGQDGPHRAGHGR